MTNIQLTVQICQILLSLIAKVQYFIPNTQYESLMNSYEGPLILDVTDDHQLFKKYTIKK